MNEYDHNHSQSALVNSIHRQGIDKKDDRDNVPCVIGTPKKLTHERLVQGEDKIKLTHRVEVSVEGLLNRDRRVKMLKQKKDKSPSTNRIKLGSFQESLGCFSKKSDHTNKRVHVVRLL